jgi:hypothetical protein
MLRISKSSAPRRSNDLKSKKPPPNFYATQRNKIGGCNTSEDATIQRNQRAGGRNNFGGRIKVEDATTRTTQRTGGRNKIGRRNELEDATSWRTQRLGGRNKLGSATNLENKVNRRMQRAGGQNHLYNSGAVGTAASRDRKRVPDFAVIGESLSSSLPSKQRKPALNSTCSRSNKKEDYYALKDGGAGRRINDREEVIVDDDSTTADSRSVLSPIIDSDSELTVPPEIDNLSGESDDDSSSLGLDDSSVPLCLPLDGSITRVNLDNVGTLEQFVVSGMLDAAFFIEEPKDGETFDKKKVERKGPLYHPGCIIKSSARMSFLPRRLKYTS